MQPKPPLSVWVISLLVTLITFILLAIPYKEEGTPIIIEHSLSSPITDSSCVVLFIGSSMTNSAIADSSFFLKQAKLTNRNLSIIKLGVSGAIYDTWNNNQLVQTYIQQFSPDILFIEDQSFLFRVHPFHEDKRSLFTIFFSNAFYHFNNNIFLARSFLADKFFQKYTAIKYFRRDDDEVKKNKEKAIIKEYESKQDEIYTDSINYKLIPRTVRAFQESPKLNDLLIRLANENTSIILLEVPRPSFIKKIFLNKKQKVAINKLMLDYQKIIPLSYSKCDLSLNTSYFRDRNHLNRKGRLIYSEWLCDQILKQTASTCTN